MKQKRTKAGKSVEGEAFLEATFNSHLSYSTRTGGSRSSNTVSLIPSGLCPSISPVVLVTFSSAALKDDKVAFRAQKNVQGDHGSTISSHGRVLMMRTLPSKKLFLWYIQLFDCWEMPPNTICP